MGLYRGVVSENEVFCQSVARTVGNFQFLVSSPPSPLIPSYIVLKYRPEMPLFDGRFIDYGCNKVQFVDLLRLMGYEYYVMTQAFAMDIVHHEYVFIFVFTPFPANSKSPHFIFSSSYRKSYLSYARAALSGPMRKLCDRFMAKAALTYPSSYNVDICKTLY